MDVNPTLNKAVCRSFSIGAVELTAEYVTCSGSLFEGAGSRGLTP